MEGPSATWRWPDETADEWERGKGRHVLASVRGACRHGRRHVGNIVASVRLGCRHTRGATSGPPVGSCEQQRHSRSDDDHQATGERRAGQPPGGSDRGPRRYTGVALEQLGQRGHLLHGRPDHGGLTVRRRHFRRRLLGLDRPRQTGARRDRQALER